MSIASVWGESKPCNKKAKKVDIGKYVFSLSLQCNNQNIWVQFLSNLSDAAVFQRECSKQNGLESTAEK